MPNDSVDTAKLRGRATRVLASPVCNLIRFHLDNVRIGFMMYHYVGGLIASDRLHLAMDDGHSYDHRSDLLTFDSPDVGPHVIVHEATHAIIDATHIGLQVSKGTHEASAYLAETVYALATKGSVNDLDIPHLTSKVYRLAKDVLDHNASHREAYVCPSDELAVIKAVMSGHMDVTQTSRMDGVKECRR